MINLSDIESIPFIKSGLLFEAAGLNPNKLYRRRTNGKPFITADEIEAIMKCLAEFGLSYNRAKNKHFAE